jgi:hypothetical protein
MGRDRRHPTEQKEHPLTEGIEFSVAVALTADAEGRLSAEVPAQVCERLGITAGDVLCWTGFFSGPVEVWSVPKSPYASLDGEEGVS